MASNGDKVVGPTSENGDEGDNKTDNNTHPQSDLNDDRATLTPYSTHNVQVNELTSSTTTTSEAEGANGRGDARVNKIKGTTPTANSNEVVTPPASSSTLPSSGALPIRGRKKSSSRLSESEAPSSPRSPRPTELSATPRSTRRTEIPAPLPRSVVNLQASLALPGPLPSPKLLQSSSATNVNQARTTVSEECVEEENETVITHFIYAEHDLESRDDGDGDALESPGEVNFPPLPQRFSPDSDASLLNAAMVGRQLAIIGDEVTRQYAPTFDQFIRALNIRGVVQEGAASKEASEACVEENAYTAFQGVAHYILNSSQISWGRIVTLLCFGYRLATTVIRQGATQFLHNSLIPFMTRYLRLEGINRWIARQGGWRAALSNFGGVSTEVFTGVLAAAVLLSIYAFFRTR